MWPLPVHPFDGGNNASSINFGRLSYSPLLLTYADGFFKAILIPDASDILRFEVEEEIRWVLIVEKEAWITLESQINSDHSTRPFFRRCADYV